MEKQDRHLKRRAGWYHYNRRVPARFASVDQRTFSRHSLHTKDLAVARQKRDALETADDARWRSLAAGRTDEAADLWAAAQQAAHALGVRFVTDSDLVSAGDDRTLLDRLKLLAANDTPGNRTALLGLADPPDVTLEEALEIVEGEALRVRLARKSPAQLHGWRRQKMRAIATFKEAAGDLSMRAITREDANTYHRWWGARIAPASGRKLHPSTGNKPLSAIRSLYRDYFAHIGEEDRPNPFRGLRFEDRGGATRPHFSTEWLRDRLIPGVLASGLNDEARDILLTMINTGARPSEIANLDGARIRLDDPIPHIDIAEMVDRELKVTSTARRLPLVGVSLEAMRRHPEGFPRYRDKETHLSNTLMKSLRASDLLETPRHKVYSLRHAFERRMKDAGIDLELRQYLMGHKISRPRYGYDDDDLSWELSAVQTVAMNL